MARRERVALAFALAGLVPAVLHLWIEQRRARVERLFTNATGTELRIGSIEAGLTGTLELRALRVGTLLDADLVEAAVGLENLLDGRFTADEIEITRPRLRTRFAGEQLDIAQILPRHATTSRDRTGKRPRIGIRDGEITVDLSDYGRISATEIAIEPDLTGLRVTAGKTQATLRLSHWMVSAQFGRAGLELDASGRHLGRLALDGGRLQLLAANGESPALEHEDVIVVRDQGTRLTGTILGGGQVALTLDTDATLHVERLPLAPFAPALPAWLRTDGRISGMIQLGLHDQQVEVTTELRVFGLLVEHPLVARAAIPLDGVLTARATWVRDGRRGRAAGRWQRGELALDGELEVSLDADGAVRTGAVHARLPALPCAAALTALPAPLSAPLIGLDLSGSIGGALDVVFDQRRPEEARLDVELDVGCEVLRDTSGAQVEALAAAYVHHLPDGEKRILAPSDANFVALADLPAWVPAAFVAAEDSRFYQHHGFDLEQLRRSFGIDLAAGKIERGGSTISQQLVKNLFLGPERTFGRKLLEAILTWRLEGRIAKRRILEVYLNVIELGAGVYGIEPAARRWFGKSARGLTAAESALLAAVTSAPLTIWQRAHADGRFDAALLRRARIILAGTVHGAEYEQAARELAGVRPAAISL